MFLPTCPGKRLLRAAAVLLMSIGALSNGPLSAQQPLPPENPVASSQLLVALRHDAQLNDVFFLDRSRGWAVGDRGAIWRTLDGGQNWALQQVDLDCPLRSVYFLNEKSGWAVGGYSDPYTQTTHGVVLRTDDGGHTWVRWKRALLPALMEATFLNSKEGWAIGQTSDLFPHALFATDDAGRTWTPVDLKNGLAWITGDFSSPLHGIVASRNGAIRRVRGRKVADTDLRKHEGRALTRLTLTDERNGCAVGPAGHVKTTADGGATWQVRVAHRSDKTAGTYDFLSVAMRDSNIWIAGSPGSVIFHSPDAGTSWRPTSTGQNLPLHDLHFVDDRNGWAVGALGTILATRDGGRSWQSQRAGGRRAAWLAILPHDDDVPLAMIAQLSASKGFIGAVSLIGSEATGNEKPATAFRDERIREAIIASGASAVDRLDGSKLSASDLAVYIDRQIRMWRPDVVITSSASPRGGKPLAHLVNQSVLQMARRAAEQNKSDDASGQLPAWDVKKVFAMLPERDLGSLSVTSAQLVPGTGRSLADYVARSRGIIHERYVASPDVTRYQLLMNALPRGQGLRDFFNGLSLAYGSDARRQYVKPIDTDLSNFRRAADRQRIVQAIVTSATATNASPAPLLAQINTLTSQMRPEATADVMLDLAARLAIKGHWSLSAEIDQLLAERFPSSPQGIAATMRLIQFYGSKEIQFISRSTTSLPNRTVSATPFDRRQADAIPTTVDPPASAAQRPEAKAIRWGKRLQDADFMAYGQANIRFALASAYRRAEDVRQTRRILLGIQRSRNRDAWWKSAAGELSLTGAARSEASNDKSQEITLWSCAKTAAKPRIDGKLDDQCWLPVTRPEPQFGESIGGDDATRPALSTRVSLAYDDEYLYIATVCARQAGTVYTPDSSPRPRDADLTGRDRIDLLLDIDRDRGTYYRLTIDHRGWTAESCGDSPAWNPEWYVAAAADRQTWTCEAAIPFKELVDTPPAEGTVWNLGLQRITPDGVVRSWTRPASIDIMPEGFGYFRFH
ncbi:MAG: YCF48-related protein [Pirellulales bacterium]